MKKISFTISERIKGLIPILNEFKGGLVALAAIVDDVKKIGITEEEWKKAGMYYVDSKGNKYPTEIEIKKALMLLSDEVKKDEKNLQINMGWSDKDTEKEIELEKETLTYLKECIEKKDKAGEITLNDIILLSIMNKIK